MPENEVDLELMLTTSRELLEKIQEFTQATLAAKTEAESFSLALVTHPAFDAVRLADLRDRADRLKERVRRFSRANECLKFLEWMAQDYETGELMHPLARLFKHKVVPSTDSRGNACLYTGDTVIEAIEKWMSETSYETRKDLTNGKQNSSRR